MPKDSTIPSTNQATTVLPGVDLQALVNQCYKEYDVAWRHQKPKKDENLTRLKLFNNQKRDKDKVGDTTMFSIFQTVFASLYTDRLSIEFRGTEDGDEETADNLTSVAKADFEDMQMDEINYNWIWDTCFFGRGLLLMEEWERDTENKIYLPLPEVLDASIFLRDPFARSVNGDRSGKGAMRFGGLEVKMTRDQMEKTKSIFSDVDFEKLKFGGNTYSLIEDAATARNAAQNLQDTNKDDEGNLGENASYTITEWFTNVRINNEVKKVKLWLANERSVLVGAKILKRDYWPIVDRPLYPSSHNWDGTSIPDLTEDKQRARAVAQNLGLRSMKADLEPMYVYDTNKFTNKADLSFGFNKFIGVDVKQNETIGNSIMPLQKSYPNMQLLQFIYESLDLSAQKATATPDIKMGLQSQQDRPLGETNLISSNVDTRYSLAAAVFGWSERKLWQIHWYHMYKDYFAEDIDEKVLRIVGAFGAKWRKLSKKDLICHSDPDVFVESTTVSKARDFEQRNQLMEYFTIALQEPTANRRWGLKKLARLQGLEKDEVDRLFPPTIDERIAEDENVLLNDNELTPVKPEDDHNVHLEVHTSAKDTKASRAHIETHKKALSIKKTNPELFPPEPMDGTQMNQETPEMASATAGIRQQRPVSPSMVA